MAVVSLQYHLSYLQLLKVIEMKGSTSLLTLARLLKIVKKYTLDSSVSNEEFLNALLEPYVEAGRVRGRGGAPYHLNAPRTSSLIAGKVDVPKALKHPLGRFGIVDGAAKNMGAFIDDYVCAADIPFLMDDVTSCFDSNSESDRTTLEALVELKGDAPRFLSVALIESLKSSNLATSRKLLWQCGSGSLSVEMGDLLSKGFGRRRKHKNIVVVPVDSTFDAVVTFKYEAVGKPHVSVKTLHGQWLQRMYACGETPDSLEGRIAANLALRNIAPRRTVEGDSRYPLGTVAVVENDRAMFFLLVISDFDADNVSHSTPDAIRSAIDSLVDAYDTFGQGLDLYLPLVGTGLSRAGFSHLDSYQLIKEVMESRAKDIHGSITVMVCPDDVVRFDSVNESR